jgi:alpha-2-macroglobulin
MTRKAILSVAIGLVLTVELILFAPEYVLLPARGSEQALAPIRHMALADDQNQIEIHQRVAANPQAALADKEVALASLATLFENRRQYERAAEYLRELVRLSGESGKGKQRLEQITGNWGQFEPVVAQPAGRGAIVGFRFRNSTRVEFTAQPIVLRKLLTDMKDYLQSNPKKLQPDQIALENLGCRLVSKGQAKYLGEEVARWSLDLEPRPNHMDQRVTVTTPLKNAGAYLLTANIENGNTNQIIIWLHDMAIMKKNLDSKSLYFVAGSDHGEPIAGCRVEFFGYWLEQLQGNGQGDGKQVVHTRTYVQATDEKGLVELPAGDSNQRYQWVAIATTPEGRLAYLGFQGIWGGRYDPQRYQQVKAYAITDRPLYQPGQLVKFKFWVRYAQHDGENKSRFAGQTFQIEIRDPSNQRVYSTQATADVYGGLTGQWKSDSNTAFGVYCLNVVNHGGGKFRIGENTKSDFEVMVTLPDRPIHPGDKFKATISARSYIESEVTNAMVKYQVLRSPHTWRHYPSGPWDWLYEKGYGWLGQHYPWYPGWSRWGCIGPTPWWIRPAPSPLILVAQREVPLGADGTVEVEIDTAQATKHHPEQDHAFRIEAEIVDQTGRVGAGTGQIIATRKPFQVMVWTDKGYYRIGETLVAHFFSSTADGKPIEAPGFLRLMKVGYEKDTPVETEVSRWDLVTDAQGQATMQIKAADAGQYRLAYSHKTETGESDDNETDNKPQTVEGGHLFTIIGKGYDSSQFQFNDLELVPDKQKYAAGEKVALQINTNRTGATVLLFVRPSDGVYLPPKMIRIDGKSRVVDIEVMAEDTPNFFIEAVTIQDGRLLTATREILVPPVERVLKVEVVPSASSYRPGGPAKVILKLTDQQGKPFLGSTVLTIHDKRLQTAAGFDTPPDIRQFFWKWRRNYTPRTDTNLEHATSPLVQPNGPVMRPHGLFADTMTDGLGTASIGERTDGNNSSQPLVESRQERIGEIGAADVVVKAGTSETELPMAARMPDNTGDSTRRSLSVRGNPAAASVSSTQPPAPKPRAAIATTALWVASLQTNAEGLAEVEFDLPESLTTWIIRVWGIGHGTRVGQGAAEVVTRQDIIKRP